MRSVQDILFDVTGQSVYFDAPEGRPSSVTSATAHPWDAGDLAYTDTALGTPLVEVSPDTLVGAASGSGQANPRSITVDDAAGFSAGRSYLLTSEDGYREWLECESTDGNTLVSAKHPLHNAYADGDAIQSTRITAPIDSTWVANINKLRDNGAEPAYRVRWVYVVSGTTYVADTYFNLVRYAGRHGVTPQDVELAFPGWLDRLPTDHFKDQGRRLIDEAFRQVKIDIESVGVDDSAVANSEIVDELVRWKALALSEMARFLSNGTSQEASTAARAVYQERLDSLVRITTKVPVRDHTGGAGMRVSLGLTRR